MAGQQWRLQTGLASCEVLERCQPEKRERHIIPQPNAAELKRVVRRIRRIMSLARRTGAISRGAVRRTLGVRKTMFLGLLQATLASFNRMNAGLPQTLEIRSWTRNISNSRTS